MKQLTLGVHLRDDATFNNFYVGDNRELMASLQAMVKGDGDTFIYFWGAKGSGRSHLLQASCHAIGLEGYPTAYIPLAQAAQLSPKLLENLDSVSLICLDDIGAIAQDPEWELALFNLYNCARDRNVRLSIVGESPPKQMDFGLADLQSRLCSAVIFNIKSLTDEQKLLVLQRRAKARGLALPVDVGRFLLNHYSRDTNALFEALDKMDKVSLAEQRRLTIPFVKQVLQ